eukprot:80101_1
MGNVFTHNQQAESLTVSKCVGYIQIDGCGSEYYGVLTANLIYFYLTESNRIMPYDVVDLSQYYQIDAQNKYSVQLYGPNVAEKLCFNFRNTYDQHLWYKSIKTVIETTNKHFGKKNSKDINNSDTIYKGWALMNCSKALYLELKYQNGDHKIECYDKKHNRYIIDTIDLNGYKTVKCYHQGSKVFDDAHENKSNTNSEAILSKLKSMGLQPNNQCYDAIEMTSGDMNGIIQVLAHQISLFKYGFVLKANDNTYSNSNDILLLFQSDNDRHEWLTHLTIIMHNQATEQQTIHAVSGNQKKDEVSTVQQTEELILSALQLYKTWIDNKHESGNHQTLCESLKRNLNMDYTKLLDCSRKLSHHRSLQDENCSSNIPKCYSDKCKYLRRFVAGKNRRSNAPNRNVSVDLILMELLDKIHCETFHTSSPSTEYICNESKDSIGKFVINTQISSRDDEKSNIQHNTAQFAFGTFFDYYEQNYENFISPKFCSLIQELTQNPYCKISIDQITLHYLKALYIKRSDICQDMKAQSCGSWNKKARIVDGEPISINHIISVLVYCNEDDAQRTFKKQTRKLYVNESRFDVYQRQSSIAHWT